MGVVSGTRGPSDDAFAAAARRRAPARANKKPTANPGTPMKPAPSVQAAKNARSFARAPRFGLAAHTPTSAHTNAYPIQIATMGVASKGGKGALLFVNRVGPSCSASYAAAMPSEPGPERTREFRHNEALRA
jgi:hypothetical protein